jgi:serine/threonine-protein kinase RsbW
LDCGTSRVLRVAAALDNLHEIRDFVDAACADLKIGPGVVADLRLAVDEAATNIVIHGYHEREGIIEVFVQRDGDAVAVHLRDDAPLFDPTCIAVPDLGVSPMNKQKAGGYGVYLLSHVVDEARYRVTDDGRNELTLIKRLSTEN